MFPNRRMVYFITEGVSTMLTRQQKRALARHKSITKVQGEQTTYNKLILAEVTRKGQFKTRSVLATLIQEGR